MVKFIDNGKQIAPCIAAKARFALGITLRKPSNVKPCSENYWQRAIDTLCAIENRHEHKQNAYKKFKQLIN